MTCKRQKPVKKQAVLSEPCPSQDGQRRASSRRHRLSRKRLGLANRKTCCTRSPNFSVRKLAPHLFILFHPNLGTQCRLMPACSGCLPSPGAQFVKKHALIGQRCCCLGPCHDHHSPGKQRSMQPLQVLASRFHPGVPYGRVGT